MTVLLLLQGGTKAIGPAGAGRTELLLKPLDPLLDQHLGHVANGARLGLGQICQALAEVFRQHHLNTRRFGPATG
jgi:hypothetical protein